jgi:hypothetical protein
MTLKSAMEDLQSRTLRAVSGLLAKLDYLASLREPDGSYSHWGLARVHGESAAQRALQEAHRGIVTKVLRTPLRSLLRDVDESKRQTETGPADLLDRLKDCPSKVVPPGPGAGTERHLNSVLHALWHLAKSRR